MRGAAALAVLHGHAPRPPVSRLARVAAKLAAAQREVLLVSPMSGAPGDPVAMFRAIDEANLRRGVRYRMLFPDVARTSAGIARRLGMLARAGAEIRTMPSVPVEALVVDGAVAIVPGEGQGSTAGIAVLRLPSVVGTITELVDRLWPAAVPLVAADPPATAEPAGRDRELLALLSAGCTDESAAAALGVSVRTVRRMVSSLMNRLGARSRFQAGVKAADRGWLPDAAR
ncbi:LuxR C-terminal-related transcriptional regulator [Prauserella oleivorans]